MARTYDKGYQPSGEEATWTNNGVTRSGSGLHKIGQLGDGLMRPSLNHGALRLPSDEDVPREDTIS